MIPEWYFLMPIVQLSDQQVKSFFTQMKYFWQRVLEDSFSSLLLSIMLDTATKEWYFIKPLILRLLGLLLVFSLLRGVFYIHNSGYFPPLSFLHFIKISLTGIRFDFSAILYVNALFILSSCLPFSFRIKALYQNIQKGLFLSFNALALFFETADIAYFGFAFRRSIVSDGGILLKSPNLIGGFLLEYWYLVLFYLFLLYLLVQLYHRTTPQGSASNQRFTIQLILFIATISLSIIGLRGGIQLRPIMPITAMNYVDDTRLIALPGNTNLSLIFSIQQRTLQLPKKPTHSSQQRPLYHQPNGLNTFKSKNVMVIVLESFGKEHIGYYHDGKGSTPFLDSLLQESYVPARTFANGLRSAKGIVAIATGIPALMDDPLMFSAYQSNQVESFGALLAKKGYQSYFFHGANAGSMEFERFAKLSGFDHYIDRQVYPKPEEDYDGHWGIWDDPFFQYAAQQLQHSQEPFAALLFSLSSHHPYQVETAFEKQFPKMDPMKRSMRYTDFALRRFFHSIQDMPWFENTLFVLTADHVGLTNSAIYRNPVHRYEVPIAFFTADHSLKALPSVPVMDQIDILPSIMDYLDYDLPYTSFGESVFDEKLPRQAVMYAEGIYQLIDSSNILLSNGKENIGLYQYKDDPALKNNLLSTDKKEKEMEEGLNAILYRHHEAMIYNLLVEKPD